MKRTVWKNGPDGKTIRRNKISGQFAYQLIEMLELPAWRILSLSAHRVLDRIQIEHAQHAGRENGQLTVTFRDFNEYGIHWNAIAPAIREVAALGFIRITQYGIASNAEFRIPNKFALTHLPTANGQVAPTNDWRQVKTIEEATAIADAARKALARFGKFPRKSRSAKTDLRYGNRSEPRYGNRISTTAILDTETVSLSATETVSLSISRGGADTSASGSSQPVTPVEGGSKPPLPADDWRRNGKTEAERLHSPDDDLSIIPEFLRRTVK